MTDHQGTDAPPRRRRVRSRTSPDRATRAARPVTAVVGDDTDAVALDAAEAPEPERAHLIPLREPVDGVPDVVVDHSRLQHAVDALRRGTGPVAIDAERASGYRYGQRAYLIQLRRAGSGSWLIDPIECPDLSGIGAALADTEWILHAATQDLPCLAEVGLRPTRLFDTELGARLAGLPRVSLGAAVEHYLGRSLDKEHSAADWSTRPLPQPWLLYAALDVEILIELRDAVADDLERQGKTGWAREEFDALLSFTGPPPRIDPWRRTSGMHRVRNRRGLAVVRALWEARDRLAEGRDQAPGRVLPDTVLVELALGAPLTAADITSRRELRAARRACAVWLAALHEGMALPEPELPTLTIPALGPPPPRIWADRDPVAARRLARARVAVGHFASANGIPTENVLTPDVLRRLLWTPPADLSEAGISAALAGLGARPWQIGATAGLIAHACVEPPTPRPKSVPAAAESGETTPDGGDPVAQTR